MKIRIKGNSIRLRLTKTEVAHLQQTGHIEEHTEFVNGTFTYALEAKAGITDLTAELKGSKITMYVPQTIANEWNDNQIVGYNNTITIKETQTLFLLLEKDFKCTDAEITEDQSDNYDNPNIVCK